MNDAVFVRIGITNLNLLKTRSAEFDYPIESFIIHEDYRVKTKENDVGLIKLTRAVSVSNPQRIRPACLWQGDEIIEQQPIAIGFGASTYRSVPLGVLMKVQLDIFDNKKCSDNFEDEDVVIDNRQLCAGSFTGSQDTCQGGELKFKFLKI